MWRVRLAYALPWVVLAGLALGATLASPAFGQGSGSEFSAAGFSKAMPGDGPNISPSPDVANLPAPERLAQRPPASRIPGSVSVQPGRRVQFYPRSSTPLQISSSNSPDGTEQIIVIDTGVVIRIDGVRIEGTESAGPVEIATDRLVIWTSPLDQLNLAGPSLQKGDTPLECYMEGNIVFRQGERVVFARSMYYDARTENGIVLDAEMLTPVDEYEGLLRLKADVLHQTGPDQFVAHGTAITSSRLGIPRYWFQTETATLQDLSYPSWDGPAGAALGLERARGMGDRRLLASSRNNLIFVGGVPVFYWPFLKTNLTKPSFYLDRISIRNDSVFGFQVLTDWDMYQLMGIMDPPSGTEWTSSIDYLSDRGLGLGSNLLYQRNLFLWFTGPVGGELDIWGIRDSGLDNLGRDRRAVPPPDKSRGRVFWRHRQRLTNGLRVTGEVGYISDKNFLEQYYEPEWDGLKDQTTGIEIQQIVGNGAWSVSADGRLNGFFAQTQWLPRLDHFQSGQALLEDHVTWYEHSQVSYANLKTAEPFTDRLDPYFPLDWERTSDGDQYFTRRGVRTATRQEIDFPVSLGPVKIVPYALGEVAYWGEDRDAAEVTRLFGQAGVRASLPMWRVDPMLENELFDLRGMAHKVAFDAEFFWADADQEMTRFPLYDPLDDDAEEAFRRRFLIRSGPFYRTPPDVVVRYEERRYALRTGLQSWVTGPTEIADDLAVIRLGARQRWQTKRGLPGRERIVDWVTLDVQGTLFPKPGRDNFGSDLGLLNYDLRWHIGDRVTLLSDGYFDTFADGLRTISLGGYLTRPGKTSTYLGLRSIEGPISSSLVTSRMTYRLSPKWITTSGMSLDLSSRGNVGQSYEITRIGESFLTSFLVRYDRGRDNLILGFAVEPRFLATSRRSNIGGITVSPAGAYGIE